MNWVKTTRTWMIFDEMNETLQLSLLLMNILYGGAICQKFEFVSTNFNLQGFSFWF